MTLGASFTNICERSVISAFAKPHIAHGVFPHFANTEWTGRRAEFEQKCIGIELQTVPLKQCDRQQTAKPCVCYMIHWHWPWLCVHHCVCKGLALIMAVCLSLCVCVCVYREVPLSRMKHVCALTLLLLCSISVGISGREDLCVCT